MAFNVKAGYITVNIQYVDRCKQHNPGLSVLFGQNILYQLKK